MKVQCVALVLLFALRNAEKTEVTPIEKVIDLLSDLKTQIQDDATAEAETYDKFACFCKDTTGEKSTSITEGNVNIDNEAATIQEKTAAVAEKETELAELKKQIEGLTLSVAEANAERKKAKAEYERVKADLDKALSQMEKAIAALEASQSFLLVEVKRIVRRSVAMADVLDLKIKHRRAIEAFIQGTQEPEGEGKGEYEFKSQGIIDTLKELQEDFQKNLDERNAEEDKAQKAHEALMAEKEVMITDAKSAESETEGAIADLKEEIATAKESLVTLEAQLKDDQLYLKDLTDRCELKAREWDQRSQMRADEVEAITKALGVIEGRALGVEADRAMLQTQQSAGSEAKPIADHRALDIVEDDVGDLGLALMQETQSRGTIRTRATKFLEFLDKAQSSVATSEEARKQKALQILGSEGRRLGSAVLVTMALKLGPDPFKKVKGLIQALIERLLKEMAEEAGHKGFCDTELGKAKSDRNFGHEKTEALSADLEKLENKKAVLEESISTLTDELSALYDDLDKGTKMRGEEKEANSETITKSTEGLEAIKEAITILKEFYKDAAKALLLQSQASPLDEDPNLPDAPPGGTYKGNQDQAGGIIGMLEVIKSDFERSIKQTTQAESEAHRSFIDFDRQSKSSISSKETEKAQAESDLAETKISIKEKMAGLQEAQSRIDDALKAIEELKPVCIDTGMSYAERVAKREEEIAALKKALCQLDTEDVESECK